MVIIHVNEKKNTHTHTHISLIPLNILNKIYCILSQQRTVLPHLIKSITKKNDHDQIGQKGAPKDVTII